MVHASLTEIPTTLKETIDWYMSVGSSTAGIKGLTAAITEVLLRVPKADEFTLTTTVANSVPLMIAALKNFLTSVAKADSYASTYGDDAKWETSCAEKPSECANIFFGTAPSLYVGLRDLKNVCASPAADGGLAGSPIGRSDGGLRPLFRRLGFGKNDLEPTKTGEEVAKELAFVDSFQPLYDDLVAMMAKLNKGTAA
ncbi:uncharacterized protein BcabD6B2_44930 [Babesia caballi]|uniref:Uncharacterized protein n=1 Tax=Babesia caballi TaxID=5871 RepID=A0AAV4LZA7_BABCB|nr:hypothetical protein, conserved [Babesia caballi]